MMKIVRHSRISHQSVCLVVLVTVVYSALLVMAAGCALVHMDQSHGQPHHHGEPGSSSQNSLCAWACQVTADTTVTIGSPSTVAELIVRLPNLVLDPRLGLFSSSTAHSRAPPSISFVRLG